MSQVDDDLSVPTIKAASTRQYVPFLKVLVDAYFTDGANVDHVLMHQLLHHTIEFKRVMDGVGAFWTEHDVEQLAKVTEGAGKYVHLLRAKAKEDKYLRSKESAAIASIADPTFMIVTAHPQNQSSPPQPISKLWTPLIRISVCEDPFRP